MAEAFWRGPLTMIFEKSDVVPYETTGGLESVAVRMPSHPVAAALIRAGGGYIAAPAQYFRKTQSHSGFSCPGRPGGEDRYDHRWRQCGDRTGIHHCRFYGGGSGDPSPRLYYQEMMEGVIGQVKVDRGLLITDEKVRRKRRE